MKLHYSFENVDMGNETIAVPVGSSAEQLRGIIKLNKSGEEIFDLLKTDTTEEDIINFLSAKYEDDREILAGYVYSLIEKLKSFGLIEE